MTWKQKGNKEDLSVYWWNYSKNESHIVISNKTEFYNLYPEFDKFGTKEKGYQLIVTPQYSSKMDIIIGYYETFEEAEKIAMDIMQENPDNIPFDYEYHNTLLTKHDIYRHTNHFIKNHDINKFPDHEVGHEAVLLTKYFGAIDKAVNLGVTVFRYEHPYYKPIII
jgi:hypothetical protein